MTRRGLIGGLLIAPFAAIAAKRAAVAETTCGKKIVFPAGAYRIAPGGRIRVVGNDVYIRGCVFEDCTVETTATSCAGTESRAQLLD